jgi:hypothetical protein
MIKYPLKKKNWLQALIKLKLRCSCKKPQATPSKIVLKENKLLIIDNFKHDYIIIGSTLTKKNY